MASLEEGWSHQADYGDGENIKSRHDDDDDDGGDDDDNDLLDF